LGSPRLNKLISNQNVSIESDKVYADRSGNDYTLAEMGQI